MLTFFKVFESVPVECFGRSVAKPHKFMRGRDASHGIKRPAEPFPDMPPQALRPGSRPPSAAACSPRLRRRPFAGRPLGYGNPRKLHPGADFRTVEDVADIRGQPVREVHHGVYLATCAQPLPLFDLRRGVAVLRGQRCAVMPGKNIPQPGPEAPSSPATKITSPDGHRCAA